MLTATELMRNLRAGELYCKTWKIQPQNVEIIEPSPVTVFSSISITFLPGRQEDIY